MGRPSDVPKPPALRLSTGAALGSSARASPAADKPRLSESTRGSTSGAVVAGAWYRAVTRPYLLECGRKFCNGCLFYTRSFALHNAGADSASDHGPGSESDRLKDRGPGLTDGASQSGTGSPAYASLIGHGGPTRRRSESGPRSQPDYVVDHVTRAIT